MQKGAFLGRIRRLMRPGGCPISLQNCRRERNPSGFVCIRRHDQRDRLRLCRKDFSAAAFPKGISPPGCAETFFSSVSAGFCHFTHEYAFNAYICFIVFSSLVVVPLPCTTPWDKSYQQPHRSMQSLRPFVPLDISVLSCYDRGVRKPQRSVIRVIHSLNRPVFHSSRSASVVRFFPGRQARI